MRAGAAVELATLPWVHWNGNERLHGYLADIPPIEYEKAHDDQPATTRWRLGSQEASQQSRMGQTMPGHSARSSVSDEQTTSHMHTISPSENLSGVFSQ